MGTSDGAVPLLLTQKAQHDRAKDYEMAWPTKTAPTMWSGTVYWSVLCQNQNPTDCFSLQSGFFKVFTSDFLLNYVSDRNSEGYLCSSTFFLDFWGMFTVQNSNVFVQENFVFTFDKSDLFINFKSDNKILLDKYVGILSWKHAPKIQKKKLKNIRSPQNFDLMHSLGENRWWKL